MNPDGVLLIVGNLPGVYSRLATAEPNPTLTLQLTTNMTWSAL
jgi:hypothetical protein